MKGKMEEEKETGKKSKDKEKFKKSERKKIKGRKYNTNK